ncbi:LEM domain protein [Necator americanus]|uniref:LEM domain protein n=1 Tax=Necator americanus TaxID=51031 RepID=W2TJR7_NECAM|nr:LEM domain protein [Necator americanus]ETN81864.1 LEM domain protein [Necator americanus]
MDLENLSDVEIRQRLTALGQNVGPVTATTRTLHLKKLRTLMAMEGDAAFSQPTLLPTMGNGSTPNHHLDIEKEPPEQDEEPLTQLRVKEVMSETPHMGTTTQTAPVRASAQVVLLAVSVLLLVVFVFFLSDRVHRQTANYGVDDEL